MIEELSFSMQSIFQLADIEKECFGKDAWNINGLRAEFSNDFSHFFAEKIDGKIVGYVCVRIMYEESQICNIAVSNNYRRRGIASQLLKQVESFVKEQGCERCELEVNVSNTPAVELYKKNGYEIVGTRVNFYRRTRYKTRDAYTMILDLTK